MLAPNPAFESAPDNAPEDAQDKELAEAMQRLPGDIRAARSAGVYSVVVPTGPTSADDLLAERPDILLPDLGHLPSWLADR